MDAPALLAGLALGQFQLDIGVEFKRPQRQSCFVLGQLQFDISPVLRGCKMREWCFGGAAQNVTVQIEFRLVARASKGRLRVAVRPLHDAALVRANRRHRARFASLRVE